MAEVLSIVAASLQLAELFAKIVIRTKELHKQLKGAPEYVRRQAKSLDVFQTSFATTERVLRLNSAQVDSYLQPEDVSFITALLGRAEVEFNCLTEILVALNAQPDGRLGTVVQATKTVRKEKTIAGHVLEICDIQRQIDSFFARHSWYLLATQSTKIGESFSELQVTQSRSHADLLEVRQHQEDDRSILQNMQTTSTEVVASQESISQGIVEVKTEVASLQEASNGLQISVRSTGRDIQEQINASQQSLCRQMKEARTAITSLHDSSQDLPLIMRSTGSDTQAHISREVQRLYSLVASLDLSRETVRQSNPALQASQEWAQPASNLTSYTSSRHSICLCQRLGRVSRLLSLGPVVISRRQYGLHYPGCQWYSPDNVILTQGPLYIELVKSKKSSPITAALARLVVLTSSFLTGSHSVPIVVDRWDNKAPGFMHIYEARREIRRIITPNYSTNYVHPERSKISSEQLYQCQQALMKLHSKLLKDFNTSRNWCRIEKSNGKTLLHEMTEIFMYLWSVQKEVAGAVSDVLHLLIQGGTSLTSTTRDIWGLGIEDEQSLHYTALTIFLPRLRQTDIVSLEQTVFLRLLSQHDIPAFSSGKRDLNRWTVVRLFVAFPDMAIEYGCARLSLAVIERDRSLVEQLIQSGAKVNDPSQEISASSFAIGWPDGVKLLLAAGAEASQAVLYAITYQDIESLKLLLDRGPKFFDPPSDVGSSPRGAWGGPTVVQSLLEFATRQCRLQEDSALEFDKMVFEILIQYLVATRSELGEVAKKNLSNSQLEDLGWSSHKDSCQILDSAAGKIFGKLREMGVIYNKRKLWPGTSKTVYHNAWMSTDVAELLFIAGFTEVDEYDINGMTPLLLNTHTAERKDWKNTYLVLLWFFDHDAKKLICPKQNHYTLLHKLAANLGTRCVTFKSASGYRSKVNSPGFSLVLERAAKLLPPRPTDLCRCFCSHDGCSPIQSLIKYMWLQRDEILPDIRTWWTVRQDLFKLWNDLCPESLKGHHNFTAFCRIELFERLGLKHTCCTFRSPDGWGRPKVLLLEQCEAGEIRAAGEISNQKLERLVRLYEELAREYLETFEEFWKTWWFVMEDSVPPVLVFWHENGTRKPPLDDKPLPIPLETLEEVVSEIREQVRRSLR